MNVVDSEIDDIFISQGDADSLPLLRPSMFRIIYRWMKECPISAAFYFHLLGKYDTYRNFDEA